MMKSIGVALIACLCIVGTSNGPASVRRIPPVDEGTRDPSFASYRQRLLHAAIHRDVPAVLSMVASRVRSRETALPETKQAFARRWKLFTDPGPFLDDLADVLRLGGRFDETGQFVAPYVYTDFDGSDDEMGQYVVVVTADAPVFAKPSMDVPSRSTVSYLALPYALARLGWVEVTLGDGTTGYMRERDVRHPNGKRVYFAKQKGIWRLVTLAHGGD